MREAVGPICPECGYRDEPNGGDDPYGVGAWAGLSDRERWAVARLARWAQVGLIAVLVVPIFGAWIDARAWWGLAGWSGRSDRALAWVVRGVTGLTALVITGAWAQVLTVYVPGLWPRLAGGGAPSAADEAVALSGAGAAAVLWSFRQAMGCWLLLRRGLGRGARSGVESGARLGVGAGAGAGAGSGSGALLAFSALAAPALSISGVLLLGLGVVVLHIVLFPPACLLLPVWMGGLAVFGVVTLVALGRLAASATLGLSGQG